jgi:hypothetical protein
MNVPEAGVVGLVVVVERGRTIAPKVIVIPASGGKLELGLPGGEGEFLFQAGDYECDVYHPIPNMIGRVWIEAYTN